ncbi:hypothetical protein BDV33DRAFT_204950 [Aspergillus novoparasiticus]|uniref:Uncharacterized protein n=1 Tax=Aspergillus novoparasiticus TaxID=986946 RepID=A0A5N6EQ58_9EURO|nr:hypothetical protein BDV33DRAFT_204950 [Aspergillus novoparasiticus]
MTSRILAISLHLQPWFDESYAPLLKALASKAEFQRAETPTSAIELLAQLSEPSADLITDEALTLPENKAVWKAVLEYGPSWGRGRDHGPLSLIRSTEPPGTHFLPGRSQLGIWILPEDNHGIKPSRGDMWYITDDDSVVQSMVFPATKVNTAGETAVALAKVGTGNLGYVGDVNAEEGSNAVVLAMCGLL